MKHCEENQYYPKLVCNKGNMLLNEINMPLTNNKAYNLQFEFNNLNTSKVNSDLLLTTQLYELLEKVNVDLIEKIHILNVLNERETDICIILKHFAKEIGIKQKYILFRSTKYLNKLNNSVTYYNKDLIYEHKDLIDNYLSIIKLDNNKYEPVTFNFGKTVISVAHEIVLPSTINEDDTHDKFIHVKFSIDFQISIADDLPIFMNNLIGVMFKKMFYNVKSYIDNLNL
jgi:hypothetical protein